jgi:hypothetical protein
VPFGTLAALVGELWLARDLQSARTITGVSFYQVMRPRWRTERAAVPLHFRQTACVPESASVA